MPPADPLDQLAQAQHPHYYPPAPSPRSRRTQTIEKTGKGWKLQQLLSVLTILTGVVLLVIGNQAKPDSRTQFIAGGTAAFVGGFIWYVFARVGTWWNHG